MRPPLPSSSASSSTIAPCPRHSLAGQRMLRSAFRTTTGNASSAIVLCLLVAWRLSKVPTDVVMTDLQLVEQQQQQQSNARSLLHSQSWSSSSSYHESAAHNHTTSIPTIASLDPTNSFIYSNRQWDAAPIVVPNYKLLLFTTPKVACTILKHFARALSMDAQQQDNGYTHETATTTKITTNITTTRRNHENGADTVGDSHIHDPTKNGLHYLYHYNVSLAQHMLTSRDWTRAVFTRDPKERLLSAYLDKGVRKHGAYVRRHCKLRLRHNAASTATAKDDHDVAPISFAEFVHTTIDKCHDVHWMPQAFRMERDYWPFVNFVGRMETLGTDLVALWQNISSGVVVADDHHGANGTANNGVDNNASSPSSSSHAAIAQKVTRIARGTTKHATGASTLLKQYYTPTLEQEVEELYSVDYQHAILNLTMIKIDWSSQQA